MRQGPCNQCEAFKVAAANITENLGVIRSYCRGSVCSQINFYQRYLAKNRDYCRTYGCSIARAARRFDRQFNEYCYKCGRVIYQYQGLSRMFEELDYVCREPGDDYKDICRQLYENKISDPYQSLFGKCCDPNCAYKPTTQPPPTRDPGSSENIYPTTFPDDPWPFLP